MSLSTVILAAGQGTRMKSNLPKILHPLAGKPLLEHVVNAALKLEPTQPPIVVYGHQGENLRQRLTHLNVTWVEQTQQLGTGHALQQALPHISADRVLVLYGDVPLISDKTLKQLLDTTPAQTVGMITASLSDPKGYGRIVRDHNKAVINIIEEKDATHEQRQINEINPGIYLIPTAHLQRFLPQLQNNNAQKEYYLTDLVRFAVAEKIAVHDIKTDDPEEILGINDRIQLSQMERIYQRKQAEHLMREGVTLLDPTRFDLRGDATIGKDVTIDINVILEGKVVIGTGCYIGPNTILRNVTIGDHVEIRANTVVDDAEIGAYCIIGPFARLRPGTKLASHVHIGNFVETKNTIVGTHTKINHLSYIGDSEIGKKVNIGAGTITCNYDGANKHRTIIGDEAFIGSNTELVAPITVGEGATIGAGSTITRHAPAHQLTLRRADQRSISNWQRPKKKEEV